MPGNLDEFIRSRRREDQRIRDGLADLEAQAKLAGEASWEQTSTRRIHAQQRKDRLAQLMEEHKKTVAERRERVRALYASEKQAWEEELRSRVETVEERKERIRERALALRAEREEHHRQVVNAAYNQQWRDACDDARALDSQALVHHVAKEREEQIRIRNELQQKQAEADAAQEAAWAAHMDTLDKQEQDKMAQRSNADVDVRKTLDEQVELRNRRVQARKQQLADEDQAELDALRQAMQEDADKGERRRREAFARGREVLEFNSRVLSERESLKGVEQEQDMILLNYAMEQERRQEEAERQKALAERAAHKEYQRHLQEQMVKEAEDTAFADEMRKREEDKVFNAREEQLRKRDEARSYLNSLVAQGREEQLRLKAEREAAEKAEEAEWARKYLEDGVQGQEEEARKQQERRETVKKNAALLKKMIAERESARRREEQEKFLETKIMEKIEREHRDRLAQQAGRVRTRFPLQSGL